MAGIVVHRRQWAVALALATALAGILLAAGAAHAQTDRTAGPVIYRLEKDSTYQQGCFEPCMCPIMEERPNRGTFVLTPTGFDGLYDTYSVTDVNWTVSLGSPELRVTGSGKYKIGGEFALVQELSLDLKVGDNPVQHFDSGLVPTTSTFPAISAAISIHGQYCFDTVLVVNAAPVPPEQIHPYRLAPQSTFQQGCFGVCLCALGPKLPIAGTFALVDIQQNSLFTEWAVVDVRWLAESSSASGTAIPVRGFGMYRYGGEFAVQQQLRLDLRVGDGELTAFDSGWVAGGAFPRIDALISIVGANCYNTWIDVHASPRRRLRR